MAIKKIDPKKPIPVKRPEGIRYYDGGDSDDLAVRMKKANNKARVNPADSVSTPVVKVWTGKKRK